MNKDQRPHSRDEKVGQGSADVEKGKKVDAGKGPVGTGNRGNGAPSNGKK